MGWFELHGTGNGQCVGWWTVHLLHGMAAGLLHVLLRFNDEYTVKQS